MHGKTLGAIGAGRIGKGVARRCRGFAMDILCYDTYQDEAFAEETGVKHSGKTFWIFSKKENVALQ